VHNSIPEYASTTGISIAMKILESSTDGAYKKKREGKRKAPRVTSIKRGSQYFERRRTLLLQKSFLM
jgi:hypothetical protein